MGVHTLSNANCLTCSGQSLTSAQTELLNCSLLLSEHLIPSSPHSHRHPKRKLQMECLQQSQLQFVYLQHTSSLFRNDELSDSNRSMQLKNPGVLSSTQEKTALEYSQSKFICSREILTPLNKQRISSHNFN